MIKLNGVIPDIIIEINPPIGVIIELSIIKIEFMLR